MKAVRVGVVGCGYWGPNHIRNMSSLEESGVEMAVAADLDPVRRAKVAGLYPSVSVVEDGETIIEDESIDAIVIASPVSTHYRMAKQALLAGKHVLVEKPFVTNLEHAEELIELADKHKLTLQVGHTFEYTAAVNRIRALVATGELGDMLYVRSLRVNLGLFQKDINVVWDLAPHDVSILLYVLQTLPNAVSTVGNAHVNSGVQDVAALTLHFANSMMANIIVSWLDPRKQREMTFVGSTKMLVYDDVSMTQKIQIFDKGVSSPSHYDSFGEFHQSARYGDIVIPMLDNQEPLRLECSHFIGCIRSGEQPRSSGRVGARVVKILEAAQKSLHSAGERVELSW